VGRRYEQMAENEAILSLEGLSVGDGFGETFFNRGAPAQIAARQLPAGPWGWTDDTAMALSIVETLLVEQKIDQAALAQRFARRYLQEPWRGYGGGAHRLLTAVSQGQDWRQASLGLFAGGGSYGNGAAMRAAPIGAYFAGDAERAAQEAQLSAEVTHAHVEGIAGGVAVAVAAALAAQEVVPKGSDFLAAVLALVPAGLTRDGIYQALELSGAVPAETAAQILGSGAQVSAQDTVPFCLWCAAYHLDDYEEALWTTVAGLGDRDTTCAIVGGIVALSAGGVPAAWSSRREPLPALRQRS
jgi:ADP-ribosylglycohydrolase